jgi:methyl-accepting chemotaxis protein
MLENMKIGKKLVLTFVLVAVISSISGVVGLTQMANLDANYSYDLNNYGY